MPTRRTSGPRAHRCAHRHRDHTASAVRPVDTGAPTGLLPIENNGEPSALYAWVFLLLAAFGPGPWALERLLPAAEREPQPAALTDRATATA
jgi:hypothetical protein